MGMYTELVFASELKKDIPDETVNLLDLMVRGEGKLFEETFSTTLPDHEFVITGSIKQKSAEDVKELVDLTEKFLQEQSIYKGKAVKVSFEWQRINRQFDPSQDCPQFMNLENVKEDDLIFGEDVQNAVNIGLFAPLENADACRRYKVPLKRGILLHGPYGTGKTLCANVTALKARKHGFTFIYLDSVEDLKKGLQFAAQHAPAVLFAEDIDRVTNGSRTKDLDAILNTLDGVDTKNCEIITVFTSNHIEDINPAALRMGRLDTLVEVTPPDAVAAVRLVKLYGRGLLSHNINFDKVGVALSGNIPAYIRETVERAKIAAISRLKGQDINGHVLEQDLLNAASSMKVHAELLKDKKKIVNPNAEVLVKIPSQHQLAQTLLGELHKNGQEVLAASSDDYD